MIVQVSNTILYFLSFKKVGYNNSIIVPRSLKKTQNPIKFFHHQTDVTYCYSTTGFR